jgi:hypothetical protein
MGVLDTLATATAARTEVEMIIDKDLHAQWEALNTKLADAAAGSDATASLASAGQIIDEMEGLRDRVQASQVRFCFEQMEAWTGYLELQADHPPREDKLVDRINGYNVETFPPALIRASCTAVIGSDGDEQPGDAVPDETWDNLFRSFNSRQMNELYTAAKGVNDRTPSFPPSARSLLAGQDSGASLAQPSPGTSAPSDSKDGSRPTSPRSTTSRRTPAKKATSKRSQESPAAT